MSRRAEIDAAAQCEGKVKYPTYGEVLALQKHLHRKFPLRIYKCKFCGSYHVGYNNSKRKKPKVRTEFDGNY